jgi:hypothetical protein
MATLLVALAVMSVLMSAVLPAWRHQARREKEEELVFRGEQYVRAIQLWERRMGPGSRPPSIDMLVDQRFLRKKYKDPMVEDGEFQLLFVGALEVVQGRGGRGPGGRGGPAPGAGIGGVATRPGPGVVTSAGGRGGIMGVTSKSKEASIRNYKGGTHYNEWRFIHAGAAMQPGGGEGRPLPDGGGRRGVGPGGRGFPMPGRGGRGPGLRPGGPGPQPDGPFPGRGRGRGQ